MNLKKLDMKNYNYYYYIGMKGRFETEKEYSEYIKELTTKLNK